MATFYYIPESDSLIHHGVKDQKWGVRQYQNADGTWTEEGKARRRKGSSKNAIDPEKKQKAYDDMQSIADRIIARGYSTRREERMAFLTDRNLNKAIKNYMKYSYPEVVKNSKKASRTVCAGMAFAGAVSGVAVALSGVASAGVAIPITLAIASTPMKNLPSVKKAEIDYANAMQDIMTVVYDQAEANNGYS